MPDNRQCQSAEATHRDDSIMAADILRGRKTVQIRHGGDVYILRETRSGKLILTK